LPDLATAYDVIFDIQTHRIGPIHAHHDHSARRWQYRAQAQDADPSTLLIIDGFGLKPLMPYQGEGFEDLISER